MIIKAFKQPVRLTLLAAIAAAAIGMPGTSASAEGLFGFLFGSPPARSMPASATAYSDLFSLFGAPAAPQPIETPASGGSVAYCVRLCDGRFFPIQRSNGADPAQICSAFLPGGPDQDFLRQRHRSRFRPRWHALRRPEKRLRLPREDRSGLHLQRQGRLRAGEYAGRRRPDPAHWRRRRHQYRFRHLYRRPPQRRVHPGHRARCAPGWRSSGSCRPTPHPSCPRARLSTADNDGRRHQASR